MVALAWPPPSSSSASSTAGSPLPAIGDRGGGGASPRWSGPMLRPRVWATTTDLVMRNMLEHRADPARRDRDGRVRQVLAVGAGDPRYVSPAIGPLLADVQDQPRPPAQGRDRVLPGLRRGADPPARRGRPRGTGSTALLRRAGGLASRRTTGAGVAGDRGLAVVARRVRRSRSSSELADPYWPRGRWAMRRP